MTAAHASPGKSSSVTSPADTVEPSWSEIVKARTWLAKRGIRVSMPTRLLAIRIGGRLTQRHLRRYFSYAALATLGSLGYSCLQYLPGVHGSEMTQSATLFFIYFALQLSVWRGRQLRERSLAARLSSGSPAPTGRPR
ncbi:hypothetical protein [Amycolatopsis sp. H20-H5]|uniref:hypothetical protein n=1 Tax=Amycolatopsis sp. H20-H5 TaxID=3046309 RepID=UPI002DBD154A|nr:hypothetical protein [Amycolatopsis sp. H20-H5]MEC3973893.1 hypothetical protein [Amycolatopsis sp. H20-H5]